MRIRTNGYRTRSRVLALLALACAWPTGVACFGPGNPSANAEGASPPPSDRSAALLDVVTVDEVVRPGGASLSLRAARNEWVDGFVQLPELGGRPALLKVGPLKLKPTPVAQGASEGHQSASGNTGSASSLEGFRAYLVASLPFDTRKVQTVRSVGIGSYGANLPRVLLPLKQRQPGLFEVPPGAGKGEGVIYLEIMPGVSTEAGTYEGTIQLTGDRVAPRQVPVTLQVDDITLSEAPSFLLLGEMGWDDLRRGWPREFKGTVARLMSRKDGKSVLAVERLDEMVRQARENRLAVGFEGLEPTIKNTPREGLRVDWSDYDSLVFPWLRGEVDRSGEGIAGFPLPTASIGDPDSDQPERQNLDRQPPDRQPTGNSSPPRDSPARAAGVDDKTYWTLIAGHFDQERLLSRMLVGDGFPLENLPESMREKVRPIGVRMTAAAITPESYRQISWTALAGRKAAASAGVVAPDTASADEPGDAAHPAWFYPGDWFGRRDVVAGLALKWARRAQQDYEILDLARRRGATGLSVGLAERITRIGPYGAGVAGEPGGDLLTPLLDSATWDEALRLAREASLARVPGANEPNDDEKRMLAMSEDDALNRLAVVLQRPVALPVGITYAKGTDRGRIPFAIELALPEQGSEVRSLNLPKAWEDTGVQLRAGGATLQGSIAIDTLKVPYRGRLLLETSGGPDRLRSEREIILPAVHILPGPREPKLDGQLSDWAEQDVIARKEPEPEFAARSGFIRMLDRRSVQRSTLTRSPKDAQVFARWRDDALFLAIRFDGIDDARRGAATNYASEVAGRASGEDLCRIAIKGLGLAPDREIRILVKPSGLTVEQGGNEPVRYASAVRDGIWRAEMRIPASMLTTELTDGAVLEFQIIRHDAATGESSSWAGPLDHDYQPLHGLLILANTLPKEKP